MRSEGAGCSPSVKLNTQLNCATHCYRISWKAIGKICPWVLNKKGTITKNPLGWSHWKKTQTCRKTLCWLLPSWLAALAGESAMRLDRFTLWVLLRPQGLWPRDRHCLHSKLALLIFLNKIQVNAQLCAPATWLWNQDFACMGNAKHRGNREGAVPGKSRIIINRGFAHHLLKLSGQGPSCWHRDVWHLPCTALMSGYRTYVCLWL